MSSQSRIREFDSSAWRSLETGAESAGERAERRWRELGAALGERMKD